ncbi:hypothetical protein [Planococcus versutus]|uniref:Uncharacterized protein n=1 Tax=Planococcus versutus TaxID=1302659 RepID=A0A1B1RXZ3_9BACL|nr:hypothetical protein [Planococcus versutus]ANU25803.1 hypothetical protein I858_001765 [Planococcus versutus]
MHPVFLGIILFSLLVSSLAALWMIKTKANKWTRILAVFFVNALILSIASAYLYKLDVQTFHKQTEGLFDSMGIVTLLFFIPINAFINILVMEFFKNKRGRTGNEGQI